MPTFQTASEEETIALGERLARELPRARGVLLIGNLGAGKTTLAKGIAKGLGAADAGRGLQPHLHPDPRVRRRGQVYHIDLYRLDDAREVATLGLDELFDRDAVVLIEWGERFPQLMPPGGRDPHPDGEEDRREITVTSITI